MSFTTGNVSPLKSKNGVLDMTRKVSETNVHGAVPREEVGEINVAARHHNGMGKSGGWVGAYGPFTGMAGTSLAPLSF